MAAGAAGILAAGLVTLRTVTAPTSSPAATKPSPAAAVVSPTAIGDPCLVGRWTVTSFHESDIASKPGTVIEMTGGAGQVLELSADGGESDDFSNGETVTGVGGGHTYRFRQQGTSRFTFHASQGQWSDSPISQDYSIVGYTVDGRPQTGLAKPNPATSGTYTCTASSLTLLTAHPFTATATYTR